MDWIKEALYKIIRMFNLDTFQYSSILITLGIVSAVFLIELLVVGWEKSSLRHLIKFDRTVRTDLISWLLVVFNLFNVLAFLLSVGICYYLGVLLNRAFDLQLVLHIENPFLQFMIVFVLSDLKNYWRHYFFHKFTPLWKLHEFHHSSTQLNILTSYRGHFLETAISGFFDVIPYVILGVPIQTFFLVVILREVHQLLIHSSIRSDWGFIGKYILVSPAAHRLHHSINTRHYQKNFASIFIFWDRLFGTYHPYEEVEEVGIENSEYNKKGYVYDMYHGMHGFSSSIIEKARIPFRSRKKSEKLKS